VSVPGRAGRMGFLKILGAVLGILRGVSPELKAALKAMADEQVARAKLTANPADDIFWGIVQAIIS
jgi:hypothetical protein